MLSKILQSSEILSMDDTEELAEYLDAAAERKEEILSSET